MPVSRSQMRSQMKGNRKMPFSKYTPKQKKLAKVAPPRNKITGADLKKLSKRKKATKKKKK
jgi:hypothetical protein|tara:strand:- start:4454 stop:4636 length:183 start_codon:yes stop_codon:yes gene_type:complete